MKVHARMWPFVKSVLFGALAGSAPFLVPTGTLVVTSLPSGFNDDGQLAGMLWIAVLPMVVAVPIVLGSSILIGLPLTAVLRRRGRESRIAYIASGAAAGYIIPPAILFLMSAQDGYWIAFLGAIGGAVTGRTWWISARDPDVC
jgi:hypothetical protein